MNLTFEIIAKGSKLFNENNYFEAHDFFEELWMDATGDEKLFLQALIQLAVGHFHLASGNKKGGVSQLTKCLDKLERFPSNYCFVNINQLRGQIKLLFNKIDDDFNEIFSDIRANKIPLINEVKSY